MGLEHDSRWAHGVPPRHRVERDNGTLRDMDYGHIRPSGCPDSIVRELYSLQYSGGVKDADTRPN